jgi:cytochrome b involved in lipid metabolism
MEEVAKHNTKDDCWTVYKGIVYDVTDYAPCHPGGMKIFAGKGQDCTEVFDKYHAYISPQNMIGKYKMGVLVDHKS